MKRRYRAAQAVLAGAGALWLGNSAWLWPQDRDLPRQMLAHRGVHQTFSTEGLGNQDCTATRIRVPSHDYLENTLPSMDAAFEAGAAVVEIDIHLTPDQVFAVFHDWTVECRTDGQGVTEDLPWATLSALDIGYGYTADGGQTFPFRGRFKGAMPRLEDVLEHFPQGRFLINFKSRRADEGTALARLLSDHPEWQERVWGVYGDAAPVDAARAGLPGLRFYTRESLLACYRSYLALGWSGHVPGACHNRLLALPVNLAPLLWGWPDLFEARMRAAGSTVILTGPYGREGLTSGIDSREDLARVPPGFRGMIWTNRAEVIGPALAPSSD